jgi:hypothetical protein
MIATGVVTCRARQTPTRSWYDANCLVCQQSCYAAVVAFASDLTTATGLDSCSANHMLSAVGMLYCCRTVCAPSTHVLEKGNVICCTSSWKPLSSLCIQQQHDTQEQVSQRHTYYPPVRHLWRGTCACRLLQPTLYTQCHHAASVAPSSAKHPANHPHLSSGQVSVEAPLRLHVIALYAQAHQAPSRSGRQPPPPPPHPQPSKWCSPVSLSGASRGTPAPAGPSLGPQACCAHNRAAWPRAGPPL